jgi:uncharacterized membrane protein (DUF485 family)
VLRRIKQALGLAYRAMRFQCAGRQIRNQLFAVSTAQMLAIYGFYVFLANFSISLSLKPAKKAMTSNGIPL